MLPDLAILNAKNFNVYQTERIRYWDQIANESQSWSRLSGYYHHRLAEIYHYLIPSGQRILELGCGYGDLLASLQPKLGVGVDFSGAMLKRASQRHPSLYFVEADVHQFTLDETFDAIILSDLVNDLWDVQAVLECLRPLTHPRTRIIINSYSRLWEIPLAISSALRLARPNLYQNWLTVMDLQDILHMASFEVIRHWEEVLWPISTPGLDRLCNRVLVRVWPFSQLALSNFILARPIGNQNPEPAPTVSVIIPVRNEVGNIPGMFERIPQMGSGTELIFVEGTHAIKAIRHY